MTTLWRIDPSTLPTPARKRKLGRKPLIDLPGLQAAIENRDLEAGNVWLVTRSSNDDLQQLGWSTEDLLHCLACLVSSDFKGAEWCNDGHGHYYACDAYAIRYDDTRRCRAPRSAIEYYLKFSIDEEGSLTLIMIRNHLSR